MPDVGELMVPIIRCCGSPSPELDAYLIKAVVFKVESNSFFLYSGITDFQNVSDITIDTDRTFFDLFRTDSLAVIKAGICCF